MSFKCLVDGCDKPSKAKTKDALCYLHAARKFRYGRVTLIRRENGTGNINAGGYIEGRLENGRRVYQHILVAEKAIGKRLPKGAVVHHVDRNRSHNAGTNLVICPNETYHRLLHRRQAAVDAGCPPSWRKCQFCQKYDAPENLKFRKEQDVGARHLSCEAADRKARCHAKKAELRQRLGELE